MNYIPVAESEKENGGTITGTLYTVLVVLFPLLSMYRFFGTMLSIGDVCALAVILLLLVRKTGNFSVNFIFLLVASFLILQATFVFPFTSGFNTGFLDHYGSVLRLLLVYFLLSMGKQFFRYDFGAKCLVWVSVISTLYLMIQLLLSRFGIYLGGGIPYLPAFREDLSSYIADVLKYHYAYRPRSLFEEPAHFCQYVIVAIALLLFDQTQIKFKKLTILFLMAGVLVSMSLLGWAGLAILLMIWVFLSYKSRKNLKPLFIAIFLIPVLVFIVWKTGSVQAVFLRKFQQQQVLNDSRFEGFSELIMFLKSKSVLILFGEGMIDQGTYYNGVVRLIYSFGLIGVLFAIALFLYGWIQNRKNPLSVALLLLVAVLSFGSEIIFGKYVLIYLIFVVCGGITDEKMWIDHHSQCNQSRSGSAGIGNSNCSDQVES